MGEGAAMPTRLDGNNTCTVQIYTNSVGAKVGSLPPERHKELVPTFASDRVPTADSRQKAQGTKPYGRFRGHQTLKTVRSW